MIPIAPLIRSLQKEYARIQREELDTDYVKGIVQGLKLAISITNTVWEKTRGHMHNNPMGISRRAA